MEVFDAVRTVLAVRSYQDRPVPDDVVQKIVEAGHLSASSMNKQPWHFVVVQDRAMLRQLGELTTTGPYVAQAPLAIVVAIEQTKFAVSDASRAVQSMILTAWAEGVGSNWAGFGGLGRRFVITGIPSTASPRRRCRKPRLRSRVRGRRGDGGFARPARSASRPGR